MATFTEQPLVLQPISPSKAGIFRAVVWFAEYLRYGPMPPLGDLFGPAALPLNLAIRRGLAAEILRSVRMDFPFLAVVFCDDNTNSDMPFGLDLSAVRRAVEIVLCPSRALSFGIDLEPTCGIAFLNLLDTFGMEEGLITDFPPTSYLFIASRGPIGRDRIRAAVRDAATDDDLMGRLVDEESMVLRSAPDADGFMAYARHPDFLVKCRFASPTP